MQSWEVFARLGITRKRGRERSKANRKATGIRLS